MALNIIEDVYLNFIPGEAPVVCHSSQYDIGRKFRFHLLNGEAEYKLNGNETITLRLRKNDTTIVTLAIPNPGANSTYVDVTTLQQMTASAGKATGVLRLSEGSAAIDSATFIMDVEEDPTNFGVTSSSAIYDLTQQVEVIIQEHSGGGMTTTELKYKIVNYEVI